MRVQPPAAILVQCFTRFWLWQSPHGSPLAQSHRHAHDLTNYFRVLRMLQNAHRDRGQWMRLQHQSLLLQVHQQQV